MKTRMLLGIFLTLCMGLSLVPFSAADTLTKADFAGESFAKIVDYFEYARALATVHGLPPIPNYWHAYVYMTYINKTGLQMLYAGLCNISLADIAFLTIPMQTFLLRYKTENNSRDVIVGSSFLMLMGFNDTAKSIYPDSPDRNDTLWASFSFGINLQQVFPNVTDFPSFCSKSMIFPLTHSDDKLTWKWGMKYTNLTAAWITTYITEENTTDTSKPWGLATYDELTFNYTLTLNTETHTATIREDHVIGKIRDLWNFWGWGLLPLYVHYNATGGYRWGRKVSNDSVYQFLQKNHVKMSVVNFQTSVLLERNTYSTSATGQDVTDRDVSVSDSSIFTYVDDGEKIIDASFGVKKTYNLFNYTEDSTESTPHTYNAITRTTQISGYERNEDLFRFHKNFARYIPLILIHMYPSLLQRAKNTIANMTRADYLYLISYPTYSGYRIEHDPIYTAYYAPEETLPLTQPKNWLPTIALVIIIVAIVLTASVLIKRKRQTKPQQV